MQSFPPLCLRLASRSARSSFATFCVTRKSSAACRCWHFKRLWFNRDVLRYRTACRELQASTTVRDVTPVLYDLAACTVLDAVSGMLFCAECLLERMLVSNVCIVQREIENTRTCVRTFCVVWRAALQWYPIHFQATALFSTDRCSRV